MDDKATKETNEANEIVADAMRRSPRDDKAVSDLMAAAVMKLVRQQLHAAASETRMSPNSVRDASMAQIREKAAPMERERKRRQQAHAAQAERQKRKAASQQEEDPF